MTDADEKAELIYYLQTGRQALLWKLDGLTEYDARRPLVPSGTNLLGLVKHLAGVEAGYFGAVFGRPFTGHLPWMQEDSEPNADMWATRTESQEEILDLYRRVREHSDETIDALSLEAVGHVPWWSPQRADVTLRRIMIHLTAETHRHAGHADIVRELIDGAVGLQKNNDNMPPGDAAWWEAYRERLETAARGQGDHRDGGPTT